MNEYMKIAKELSDDNLKTNVGGPFGACIVKDGKIIGKGSNHVLVNNDPTAHAEIMAIRDACKYIDSYDLTKDYLDRNNIYYDKIIVDIGNKDKACLDEKIDLFIDDSYKHCKEVCDVGINVLMIDNDFNKDCFEFNKINNWNEIYKYIENGW